jgi:hypothetical protein
MPALVRRGRILGVNVDAKFSNASNLPATNASVTPRQGACQVVHGKLSG